MARGVHAHSLTGYFVLAYAWHASFNFVTASAAGAGTVAAITSMAVVVWALVIVWRYRPATLAAAPKQVTKPADATLRPAGP